MEKVALAGAIGADNHVDGRAEGLGNYLVFVALEALNNHLHSAHSVVLMPWQNTRRQAVHMYLTITRGVHTCLMNMLSRVCAHAHQSSTRLRVRSQPE